MEHQTKFEIPRTSISKSRTQEDLQNREDTSDIGGETMLRKVVAGRKPRVCIVGAGIAGLRAADVLLQKGAQVTLLEARNRSGGRVAQSNHLGYPVDLGPNWIHGTKDNPILELAKRTETATHFWDERQAVFDTNGKAVQELRVSAASEAFWSIVADAFTYSNQHSETIAVGESLMDYVEEKAKERYPEPRNEDAREDYKMLLNEAEMWGAFVGGSIRKQSLKFFWLEECIEGENPFVAGTFGKILEAISRPVLSRIGVKFQHQVTAVESYDGQQRQTHVKCSNGYSESFDEVVVTAPLGWLKRNQEVFKPDLPPRIAAAINALGYGNLDKAYITFPRAFWNGPSEQASTLKGEAHRTTPNVTAPTAPVHNNPSSSNRNPVDASQYPGFIHFAHPQYAPRTNPSGWQQQAVNLAALSPDSLAHPTLLFYFFGACADHIASLATTTSPADHRDAAIAAFFAPYFSLLPNYDPADPDCVPSAALATAWTADEFAGCGSYTNFQVGLERGDRDVEALREGVPERGVWFAGEHTSPFVALGTTTGAYWAGEGVARRIGELYGLVDGG